MPKNLQGDSLPQVPRQDDRVFERVAPADETEVRVRVERGAKVIDASNGGVGLVVDHPWGFSIGDRVLLWSNDTDAEPIDYAEVKNVRLLEDGRWRIGLQWCETTSS
ncbi:PilZ domain-containing protein [Lignipirellula cremea]|uniref:PilZ domain-containing protein n=1 Tax=Lignipirellula cremea TaxID=2528010 RepID=A0A518DR55_9BACT|nr:PilZ domain-containing protein [Lignipirellula cremea]QDU94317.1 hypothetical protein Pla8534_21060 [Lignipirellula cremea]